MLTMANTRKERRNIKGEEREDNKGTSYKKSEVKRWGQEQKGGKKHMDY